MIPANWKLVWENNRECFHCNINHPQYIKANFDHYNEDDLNAEVAAHVARQTAKNEEKWRNTELAATHTDTGLTPFPDAEHNIWYSANRTILVEGWVTESVDGKRVCDVLMGDYEDEEVGTARARTLPNFWNHSSCDHGVTTRLTTEGTARDRGADDLAGRRGCGRRPRLRSRADAAVLAAHRRAGLADLRAAAEGRRELGVRAGPLSQFKEYNLDSFLQLVREFELRARSDAGQRGAHRHAEPRTSSSSAAARSAAASRITWRKLGATDVLLIERSTLTSGCTWHAAGLVGSCAASRT
jgi:hypothetical protein